jgi:hypothetical protein
MDKAAIKSMLRLSPKPKVSELPARGVGPVHGSPPQKPYRTLVYTVPPGFKEPIDYKGKLIKEPSLELLAKVQERMQTQHAMPKGQLFSQVDNRDLRVYTFLGLCVPMSLIGFMFIKGYFEGDGAHPSFIQAKQHAAQESYDMDRANRSLTAEQRSKMFLERHR